MVENDWVTSVAEDKASTHSKTIFDIARAEIDTVIPFYVFGSWFKDHCKYQNPQMDKFLM